MSVDDITRASTPRAALRAYWTTGCDIQTTMARQCAPAKHALFVAEEAAYLEWSHAHRPLDEAIAASRGQAESAAAHATYHAAWERHQDALRAARATYAEATSAYHAEAQAAYDAADAALVATAGDDVSVIASAGEYSPTLRALAGRMIFDAHLVTSGR